MDHPFALQDVPQPIRGNAGAADEGPRSMACDRRNGDMPASPATDQGALPNLKFLFSDARNRLENGGWARGVPQQELPIVMTLSGRLLAGEKGNAR